MGSIRRKQPAESKEGDRLQYDLPRSDSPSEDVAAARARYQNTMRKFIIFTSSYDEKIGGVMVLHQLAALLEECGREVRLWPMDKPVAKGWRAWPAISWHLHDWGRRVFLGRGFRAAPDSRVRLAMAAEIADAIVVYPEVVDGNPLGASRVVRWFLHKPGFHTGRINFAPNELHFHYQKAFDFRFEGAQSGGELFLIKVFSDIYKNEHRQNRAGRCYILKKGAHRAAGLDLSDGIVIDQLSHQEIARIFNRVEYCISFDPHTYYSVYAAMCGCKSIIVPVDGVSKEQWQPVEELRYGLAYGEDDLDHAASTMPRLLDLWATKEAANRGAVTNFLNQCDAYFG